MIKYSLVWGCNEAQFEKEVNDKLEQGYKIHGQISTCGNSSGQTFVYLSMTKEVGETGLLNEGSTKF